MKFGDTARALGHHATHSGGYAEVDVRGSQIARGKGEIEENMPSSRSDSADSFLSLQEQARTRVRNRRSCRLGVRSDSTLLR